MSRTSTEPRALTLSGRVMGTVWSAEAVPDAPLSVAGAEALRRDLAAELDRIDAEMSAWRADSDLMRLNAAPAGAWQPLPWRLMGVLEAGLEVGRASGGAFDVGLGDLTRAWGFLGEPADATAIRAALGRPRPPAHDLLELDPGGGRARKHGPVALDLGGIAKGYACDRMLAVCDLHGLGAALLGLDGEFRARGRRADGQPWTLAVEAPRAEGARAAHSVIGIGDAGVATSGDYRHWVQVGAARLSHSMDRRRGGPVEPGVASVTVRAPTAMAADAWATAILVAGPRAGAELAARQGLEALILLRTASGIAAQGVGALFAGAPAELLQGA